MTGWHPSHSVRKGAPSTTDGVSPSVPPRTSCDCQPHTGEEYCQEGVELLALYGRAVRINHQFCDRIPLNNAVAGLMAHWDLNRKDTLVCLMKQPWDFVAGQEPRRIP